LEDLDVNDGTILKLIFNTIIFTGFVRLRIKFNCGLL
jgi:hypothetical protein